MKFKNLLFQESFCRDAVNRISLKDFTKFIDLNNKKLKKIEAMLFGNFQSTKFGSGFDFNEIREYKMGDDLRHISWSTTAKTGNLHTKEYYSEKEIRTYFLLDISNSMLCGNKLEPFLKLFAYLLLISNGFSEKTGGIFFTSKIKYNFQLGQAKTQTNLMFQTLIDILMNLNVNEKEMTSYNKTNIGKALEFSNEYFKKKGLVFIISDFVSLLPENWQKILFNTSQKQNIYSFQIYDPLDFELPKSGYITLIDPETNKRIIVNTDSSLVQKNYIKLMKHKQDKLAQFLRTTGINHIQIQKSDFI